MDRPAQSSFFAARNARADKQHPFGLEVLRPADGIGKMRVAAVNEDVALVQERKQLLDQFIHRLAGLDHHHDLARTGKRFHEILDRLRSDEVFSLSAPVDESFDNALFHAGNGSVVNGHGKALAFHVERKVFTHHGQSDHPDIRFIFHAVLSTLCGCGQFKTFFDVPRDPGAGLEI